MPEERYIRFDWAIKRLLRHKADFVAVEGTSLPGEPLKIAEALENEGNRQAADDKTNRVNVLVKNTRGRKIIIDIQNYFEDDSFHRMLYGTSLGEKRGVKRGIKQGREEAALAMPPETVAKQTGLFRSKRSRPCQRTSTKGWNDRSG